MKKTMMRNSRNLKLDMVNLTSGIRQAYSQPFEGLLEQIL